jgi:pimeloyl-ACP methyl ester carboxylesterase
MRQWVRDGMAGDGNALVAAFEKMVGSVSDGYAARLRAADLEAYLAAAQDRVSMEDVLEAMAMPCCVYAGDADPAFGQAKSASERIPHARFFSLPGLSHLQAFVESSRVLPPVMGFLGTTR